jgi:hypothetical protein
MGNIVMTLPLSTSYFKGKSKDLGKARAKDKSKDKDKMKGQAKVKDKAKDKSKDQAKVKEKGKGNSKGKDKHNRGQVSWWMAAFHMIRTAGFRLIVARPVEVQKKIGGLQGWMTTTGLALYK